MGVFYLEEKPIEDFNSLAFAQGDVRMRNLKEMRVGAGNESLNMQAGVGFWAGAAAKADANAIINLDGSALFRSVLITGLESGSEIDGAFIAALSVPGAAIADAAITNAKINDLSASKINAGTLNASVVNVINLNADNINAGTLVGRSVRAISGASGADIHIDAANKRISFLYDGDEKGYLYANSSGQMKLDASSWLRIVADGSGDDIEVLAGDHLDLDCDNFDMHASNNINMTADSVDVYFADDGDGADCHWRRGTDDNLRFKFTDSGNGTCDGAWTGGGADYAEMFESVSGKAIPVGTPVALEGEKVRPAKKTDPQEPIGVISATAGYIGNAGGNDADENWSQKYVRDAFGRYVMEEKEYWVLKITEEATRPNGEKYQRRVLKRTGYSHIEKPPKGAKVKKIMERVVNPAYDPEKVYKPRIERPEWQTVGLVGRVRIIAGSPVAKNWVKLKTITPEVEEWLIR